VNDCVVDIRSRDTLSRLGQNAIQKRQEKTQAKYLGELKKEHKFVQKQLLEIQERNKQLLWQERQHLDNLRKKKLLEKNQEGVALIAERAKLQKQVREAQEKTLQEEQRGCKTHEEVKDSAIVARAARLAENDMAKKPTYSFIKEARETLTEITGDFAQKATEEAELKKEVINDPTFSVAKQNFNRHHTLLESRKTFDALSTKPSLAATPAVQGALDGQVSGAILVGEMSQLQYQIEEIKTSNSCPFEVSQGDDMERQMDAVIAEIEGIDPSKFLKELPEMPEMRSATPSTQNCSDNYSRSGTASSWSSATGSCQSTMSTAYRF